MSTYVPFVPVAGAHPCSRLTLAHLWTNTMAYTQTNPRLCVVSDACQRGNGRLFISVPSRNLYLFPPLSLFLSLTNTA
jgi:hypothetical protein